MQSLWRRVAWVALVSSLALSGIIPPEHVHEADADHPSAITHRHFEAHDHEGTEVSDGEGGVVWLDNVAVEHARIQVSVTRTVLAVTVDAIPPATASMAVQVLDAAPPHGPPRATAPVRAPPASSPA
jgi:hypothetical protein